MTCLPQLGNHTDAEGIYEPADTTWNLSMRLPEGVTIAILVVFVTHKQHDVEVAGHAGGYRVVRERQ